MQQRMWSLVSLADIDVICRLTQTAPFSQIVFMTNTRVFLFLHPRPCCPDLLPSLPAFGFNVQTELTNTSFKPPKRISDRTFLTDVKSREQSGWEHHLSIYGWFSLADLAAPSFSLTDKSFATFQSKKQQPAGTTSIQKVLLKHIVKLFPNTVAVVLQRLYWSTVQKMPTSAPTTSQRLQIVPQQMKDEGEGGKPPVWTL